MKPHVIISGGTGLIGSHLTALLIAKGYRVSLLSRQIRSLTGVDLIRWDPVNQTVDDFEIQGDIAIINLAGENLTADKWDEHQKKIILSSRTNSLKLLGHIIDQKKSQISRFVSTSAIGYYGTVTSDTIYSEDSKPGNDFLAQTCIEWEGAIQKIARTGVSTSWIRTGVVLSDKGGALRAILGSTRSGFSIPLGSGKQWMPWIHIRDLIRMFEFLLENPEITGVFNGVAPAEDTNRDLMKAIAKAKKKIYLPVGIPEFLIKSVLGEMASISLYGSRVSAEKILGTGFQFHYTQIEQAIKSFGLPTRVDK